jgi:hypothetical protein
MEVWRPSLQLVQGSALVCLRRVSLRPASLQAQQSVGAMVEDMPGTATRLDRLIGTLG